MAITQVAATSGTVTSTVATVTLPTYLTTDYIVLAIASNNANAQTFGANVTATALGSTTNRLNLWKIVPTDGSQTTFTVTIGASSVLTWWCASYRGVNATYVAGAVTNAGNSTTAAIEGIGATASWVATGNERVLSVGTVNSTATWTTTGSTVFNTTSGNAALMVNSDAMTLGALTAIPTTMDRGLGGTSRNESAGTVILSASSDDATRQVNRLTNPSFEDAAGTSTGWETEETVAGTPAFTKVTTPLADGARAQQMQYTGQSGDSGILAIYQSPITATPGEVLTFKVSLAGSKANCSLIIGIEGFSTGQVYISESDTSVTTLTGSMVEYTVSYTVPPTGVAVACYIQGNEVTPTTAITAQIDKASLVQTGAPATGSASLSLTGTGDASASATGTASLTLTGSGTAGATTAGTAALSLTAGGTARAAATGTAALTLTATGTGEDTPSGTAATGTAAITLTGAGGGGAVTGSSASLTLTGTGNGAAAVTGTAALTLASTGTLVALATSQALLTLTGTGAAVDFLALRDITVIGTLKPRAIAGTLRSNRGNP